MVKSWKQHVQKFNSMVHSIWFDIGKFHGLSNSHPHNNSSHDVRKKGGNLVMRFFNKHEWLHLNNEKNPGWLGNTEDYTTQVYGDYNKPL